MAQDDRKKQARDPEGQDETHATDTPSPDISCESPDHEKSGRCGSVSESTGKTIFDLSREYGIPMASPDDRIYQSRAFIIGPGIGQGQEPRNPDTADRNDPQDSDTPSPDKS